MLERDAIASAMDHTLEQARAGRGAALFILGDAGLGKTACLRAARDSAAGMRIGVGRADPMESALPFGLMTQLTRELGGTGLFGGQPSPVSPLDAQAGRFISALSWLENQAGTPVLLAADDLHWSDLDSLALLSFLVRRISSLPVAIIGTLRPWPSVARDQVAALAHDAGALLARLEPLSERAAGVLLADRAGRPIRAQVAGRAWEACAGNPLLLEQVAAVLERGDDAGGLLERGGRRFADRLLLARFAGLSPTGLAVARAAAVLGGRFRAEPAARVANVAADDADTALDALARGGLIRAAKPGGMEFVHPLFRQALYEDTSPPMRARLHARAFTVLHASGLDDQACEHALRGELAGVPEPISLLEATGRTALAAGAVQAATERFAGAVQLAGSRARPELLLAWGEASLWRGRAADAIHAMERVLASPGLPPVLHVHAIRMIAMAHTAAGSHELAALAYERAFRQARADYPELAAEILLDHALASWLTAGPVRALPLASKARRIARRAGPGLRSRADVAWGFLALQAGDPSGVDLMAATARPLLADPAANVADLSAGLAGTLLTYYTCAVLVERHAESMAAGTALTAAAGRAGAVQTLALISTVHAYNLFRAGRLPEALELIGQAAGLADLFPMIEPYAAVGHAHILLHLGRLADVEPWCARAEAKAAERGEWNAMLFLFDVRGQRLLREGKPRQASDLYRKAEQTGQRMGVNEPCLVPWGRHAITAHSGAGRPDDAKRVISWLDRCAARLPCQWPRIAAVTGRALLAEQAGHRDQAEACFDQALSLHEGLSLPVERAETLLDYGALLRRGGKTTRARAVLAEAVSAAEAIGASWLAGLAARELTIAGGRRRRRLPARFTAQETRVARLVAAGNSNAELARQLSVSVNTVETHLRHIYAKTGVHSRLELVAFLADQDATTQGPALPVP
jgi:DNA-binding CsgD family transcriptional regulator